MTELQTFLFRTSKNVGQKFEFLAKALYMILLHAESKQLCHWNTYLRNLW